MLLSRMLLDMCLSCRYPMNNEPRARATPKIPNRIGWIDVEAEGDGNRGVGIMVLFIFWLIDPLISREG